MEVFRALKQKKGGEKGSKGKPKREGERPGHKRKSKSKAEGSKERTSKKIDETGEADLLAASEILSMASSESRGSPSSSVVAATAPISSSSVAIAAPTTPSIGTHEAHSQDGAGLACSPRGRKHRKGCSGASKVSTRMV